MTIKIFDLKGDLNGENCIGAFLVLSGILGGSLPYYIQRGQNYLVEFQPF